MFSTTATLPVFTVRPSEQQRSLEKRTEERPIFSAFTQEGALSLAGNLFSYVIKSHTSWERGTDNIDKMNETSTAVTHLLQSSPCPVWFYLFVWRDAPLFSCIVDNLWFLISYLSIIIRFIWFLSLPTREMKKKKKKNCQKRNRLIVFKTSTCSFNSPVIIVCVCVFFSNYR